MPADRAMPPRNQRNSNKATNSRNQGDAQSFPPNQQLSTNDSPKQRKKRIQISDQLQQTQQPRQSVFERLGTKNAAAAPLPRQPKNKKEIKDHIPINEPRKTRRISDSRKAERDLSEGEISQEVGKFKDRQLIEPKSKTDSSFNKNSVEPIKNNTSHSKNTFREDLKSEKSIIHDSTTTTTTTTPKDHSSTNLKDSKDNISSILSNSFHQINRTRDADNELSGGIQHSSYDTISHDEDDHQNITNDEMDKIHILNLQKVHDENLSSIDNNSNEISIKKRKISHDDIIEGEESEDAAKEDVVSIQADDDFSLHSDNDDGYPGYLSPPDDGQLPMDHDFIDHEKSSSHSDSIQGRERFREKDLLRSKDNNDLNKNFHNRQNSDDSRVSEKDRNLDRINRDNHHVPPHKDDRRRIPYDRDSREKLRDERYNRTNVPIRDHRDHRPHEVERDRRERERQERYNQSVLEDKAHFDNQRRPDRFLRDDRGRNDHGNRTPTADTSSNSTVRGDTSERLITRRDDRTTNVRQKNDTQNDSNFQDNRNRDRDPVQRNIQQNIQSELDRPEKRKKDESEVTERKPYLDREQRNDPPIQPIQQRIPEYRPREKDRDIRQRDEFVTKDNMRLTINRDQDRELPTRRDDRTSGLPDLYRPSSDHHIREPDRRPIREFDRDYRDRDLRAEPIGIDRYRGDYSRENNQGRDRMLDNHPREIERRMSWDFDNRGGASTFSDKDQIDHRRERDRERPREVGHKSRSTSAELKNDSHKHSYDFHQREPERRITRDVVENDQMNRTNRAESIRRVEIDRHSHFINDKYHDSNHDFSLDALQREEQDIDLQSKDLKIDQVMDDELLPEPWQKCMSRKNKLYYFNPLTRESRWTFPTEEFGKRLTTNESESNRQISPSGMNYSTQNRLRRSSNEDDRNIYNGGEDRMETSTEINEFRMNNRRSSREFNNKSNERADLENGIPLTETRTPNDVILETEPNANFTASDEEAWRTEDDIIDDVLADTEPESLFLFRRSRSPSPTSNLLSDDDIIRRQIAPIWNHITSSVAGDELFQQFEQIMNNNNNNNNNSNNNSFKKKMRILNSRKEFDRRRAIFGGKRMVRYKVNNLNSKF
ncbi:hypothetical protein F8M41_016652 [Gigaspora margarita]|uniref:WW domain-containing protein n=1 Tax=Gigaspora margarita TaxID=4874 RepID=A0A8H4EMM4_GIGMA|nr:hypothetical protein F8M41_016652 [Gigaspora margarita]